MARNQIYSQLTHSVVIDGTLIDEGISQETDAILFEPDGDSAIVTKGLNGNVLSFASSRPCTITLKLFATSSHAARLNEIVRENERGEPRTVTVEITTGVNSIISVERAAVSDASFSTGGPEVDFIEFKLLCENYELSE